MAKVDGCFGGALRPLILSPQSVSRVGAFTAAAKSALRDRSFFASFIPLCLVDFYWSKKVVLLTELCFRLRSRFASRSAAARRSLITRRPVSHILDRVAFESGPTVRLRSRGGKGSVELGFALHGLSV